MHESGRQGAVGVPVDTGAVWSSFTFGAFQQWDPSPPYSPAAGYDSPYVNNAALPYFQPHLDPVRHDSHASFLSSYAPHTSRSPVSAGSSTVHIPQWGTNTHNVPYTSFDNSSGSEGSYGDSFNLANIHMVSELPYTPSSWGPEDRDFVEQGELAMNLSTSRSSSLDLSFDEYAPSGEERYLDSYWTWTHPFYPVIQRRAFDATHASPLLKAAMLALGASACEDTADKQTARLIHERCMKVLQKVVQHSLAMPKMEC